MNAPDAPAPPPPAPPPTATVGARPRRLTVALSLVAIFVCGVLIGALGTLRALRAGARHRLNPDRWSPAVMEALDRRLVLSPEQRERIAPLVRAGAEEARGVRERAVSETLRIVEKTRARVAEQLSPEQARKLDEFIAQRHRRARHWLGPHPRHDAEPPPGPAR